MEEQARQVAALLKLLANPHRLLALCALESGEMTVTELGGHVPNIGMSALSQHLAVLKASGLIDCDKRGQNVFYRLADRRISRVIQTLKETYCAPEVK